MATTRLQLAPRHMAMTPERKAAWAREHYGEFARIARRTGFSRCYVSQCFNGHKRNIYIDHQLDVAIFGKRSKRLKRAA